MEQLKLELDAELARFLSERAQELRSTPDVLVASLLTHWHRIAHDKEPLGSDETVQDRMAKVAEHYVDESREMLDDDPGLSLDVTTPPPGAVGAAIQEQAPSRGSGDGEPAAQMSEAEIRQAFAEIAENYEEISREVFGVEPPLSAGPAPEHHLVAYRFSIPEKPQSANWTTAMIKSIESILTLRTKKRPPELSQLILHMRLPEGEQIDGPTLLFVEPDPVRSRLSAAADQ